MTNTRLLRKVADRIRDERTHFDMDTFLEDHGADSDLDFLQQIPLKGINCQTSACIAGWAVILNTEQTGDAPAKANSWGEIYWETEGAEVLGISDGTAQRLFFTHGWPQWTRFPEDTDWDAIDDTEIEQHNRKWAVVLLEMLIEGVDPWQVTPREAQEWVEIHQEVMA